MASVSRLELGRAEKNYLENFISISLALPSRRAGR